VVIGETVVVADGMEPFVIQKLEASIHFGRAVAVSEGNAGWAWTDEIRPYVAPVVKEMVLYGRDTSDWSVKEYVRDTHRLTLSGVSMEDLSDMSPGDVIEGSYKIVFL